ncbi:MAG: flagellar hook-basal body complex protein [Candidatus Caenarcaniphilales bacterium]|nr:flagellar hook-basal body complex protein [Candidatus Caenarcaniphilales bacterium]
MPLSSLFIGSKGVTEHQKAVATVANNLSNVNTVAFKKTKVAFQESVGTILKNGSNPSTRTGGTNPMEIGTGVDLASVATIFDQGSIRNTGQNLNLAINGDGFFVVSTGAAPGEGLVNTLYTRNGNFNLDAAGNMVTAGGNKIMGATFFNDKTGEAKTIDNYTGVTYWTDQDISTSGEFNYNMNTTSGPDLTGTAGPGSPSFDISQVAELSVRGSITNPTSPVNIADAGNLEFTMNAFGNFVIAYDETGSTPVGSRYEFEYDPSVPLSTATNTFLLQDTAGTGEAVQFRLRLKPGVTRFEQAFTGFTFAAGVGSSLTLPGGAPWGGPGPQGAGVADIQTSTTITIGEDDVPFLKTIDMQNLFDPIKVPPFFYTVDSSIENSVANVSIGGDGSISIFGSSSERMIIGRVILANFRNYDGLLAKGSSLYTESPNSGVASIALLGGPSDKSAPVVDSTQIVSGGLEMGNVDIAEEFSDMIAFQRGLQASARTISISDEILQSILNI